MKDRIKPSDPLYETVNALQNSICMLTNPSLYGIELKEDERKKLIDKLEKEKFNVIKGGTFGKLRP